MHIGASGIVFGYIFYVIVRGLFTRRFLHLIVGLVIGFYYGLGALAGLAPLQDGISWQGHLGGTIGGVLSAAGLRKERGKQTAVNAAQVRWSAGAPCGSRHARPSRTPRSRASPRARAAAPWRGRSPTSSRRRRCCTSAAPPTARTARCRWPASASPHWPSPTPWSSAGSRRR